MHYLLARDLVAPAPLLLGAVGRRWPAMLLVLSAASSSLLFRPGSMAGSTVLTLLVGLLSVLYAALV